MDCVPVGAIVVDDDEIIGEGYNKKEKTNNPLDHAEIIAIKEATKNKKNWNLSGCTLYTSMKPCEMCKMVIKESRITKVKYLVENAKEVYKTEQQLKNMKMEEIVNEAIQKEYVVLLKKFFLKKR